MDYLIRGHRSASFFATQPLPAVVAMRPRQTSDTPHPSWDSQKRPRAMQINVVRVHPGDIRQASSDNAWWFNFIVPVLVRSNFPILRTEPPIVRAAETSTRSGRWIPRNACLLIACLTAPLNWFLISVGAIGGPIRCFAIARIGNRHSMDSETDDMHD